jgi:hypothetical protein
MCVTVMIGNQTVTCHLAPARHATGIRCPHTDALSVGEIVARHAACRLAVGAVRARDGHRAVDSRAI